MTDRSILWVILGLSTLTATIAVIASVKAMRTKAALESSVPYKLAQKLGLAEASE